MDNQDFKSFNSQQVRFLVMRHHQQMVEAGQVSHNGWVDPDQTEEVQWRGKRLFTLYNQNSEVAGMYEFDNDGFHIVEV